MKKSIKILSLVLAIALICGAFIVGAFASTGVSVSAYVTGTGERLARAHDFDTEGWDSFKATGSDAETSNVGGLQVIVAGRNGTFEVVTSEYQENNRYALFTDNVAGSSAYLGQTITYDKANSMDKYPIQVFDFDVFFPNGQAPSSWNFTMYYKYFDANGTSQFHSWNHTLIKGNTDGSITIDGGQTNIALSTDAWSHITYIIEMQDSADGTTASKIINHIAVNGVIVDSVEFDTTPFTVTDSASYYEGNTRNIYVYDPRINLGGNGSSGAQLALDNMIHREYSKDYADYADMTASLAAGAGTSITGWDANLYDATDMPFGNPVAKIGDTYYDDLQKAVDAAEAGDTIDLCKSVTTQVTVNKQLTVNKNGYTANLISGDYTVKESDTAYVIETVDYYAEISIIECACGNNCFGSESIYLTPGTNIIAGITNALGSLECSYTSGSIKYKLDGFIVEEFDEANRILPEGTTTLALDSTATVPETIEDGAGLELTPHYAEYAPVIEVLGADGNKVAEYYQGESSLKAIIAAATDGQTVKLLADFTPAAETITVKANVTLDLNGYTLKNVYSASAKNNSLYWFGVNGGKTFTVTSSQAGGQIFNGTYIIASDAEIGAWANVNPFLASTGTNATIKVVGKNADGETTLRFFGGYILEGYGDQQAVNIDIDGGEYYVSLNDGFAASMFWFSNIGTVNIKNALFAGSQGPLFATMGRYQTANGYVNIDNCVLATSTVSSSGCGNIFVNITNSYIGGSIDATKSYESTWSTVTPATGNEWTIGAGCYIADGIALNGVNIADDCAAKVIDETVKHEYKMHSVVKNEAAAMADAYTVSDSSKEIKYTKYTERSVNVNWTYNGESLGTSKVVPGGKATSPAIGDVEGTKGLVVYSLIADIPADVVEGATIEVTDDMEKSYSAGKVPVQFNFNLTSNFALNFYVPVVDGITYVPTGTTVCSNTNRSFTGSYIDAEGSEWRVNTVNPGVALVDSDLSLTIAYTCTIDGVAYNFTYTIGDFNIAEDYVKYLLERTEPVSSTALKNAMADCMKYIYYGNILAGKTPDAKFLAVYNSDAVQNNFSAMPEITGATNSALDTSDMSTYVESITVLANSSSYKGVATVAVTTKDGYAARIYPKSYASNPSSQQNVQKGNEYNLNGVRNGTLNETFVIEIYEGCDTSGSSWGLIGSWTGECLGTYEWSLAGYINDMADTLTEDQKAFVEALYCYAESCDKYAAWKQLCGF